MNLANKFDEEFKKKTVTRDINTLHNADIRGRSFERYRPPIGRDFFIFRD